MNAVGFLEDLCLGNIISDVAHDGVKVIQITAAAAAGSSSSSGGPGDGNDVTRYVTKFVPPPPPPHAPPPPCRTCMYGVLETFFFLLLGSLTDIICLPNVLCTAGRTQTIIK